MKRQNCERARVIEKPERLTVPESDEPDWTKWNAGQKLEMMGRFYVDIIFGLGLDREASVYVLGNYAARMQATLDALYREMEEKEQRAGKKDGKTVRPDGFDEPKHDEEEADQ